MEQESPPDADQGSGPPQKQTLAERVEQDWKKLEAQFPKSCQNGSMWQPRYHELGEVAMTVAATLVFTEKYQEVL